MLALLWREVYLGHGGFDFLFSGIVVAAAGVFVQVEVGEHQWKGPIAPALISLPEYPSHQKILLPPDCINIIIHAFAQRGLSDSWITLSHCRYNTTSRTLLWRTEDRYSNTEATAEATSEVVYVNYSINQYRAELPTETMLNVVES